jgi:hypothetical protein
VTDHRRADPFFGCKVVEIALNHEKLAKDYAQSIGRSAVGSRQSFTAYRGRVRSTWQASSTTCLDTLGV